MAASSSALTAQFHNCHRLVDHKKPSPISISSCKLNPYANPVGPPILSWQSRKFGKTRRSLHVHGLFGGKEENNDKSDDASSKVECILSLN
ncbi:unnamed protein product [Ilex paraguariensis]|uniref:Uncharacterized protein n=1 Tax=Ilex paraguariensis TaxID=185542 RepID=A0ABC8RXE3_9AQUA